MKRYFFELSYKGTRYFGWQKQPKQNTVQEEIEKALTKVNSNNSVDVVGCGRTDAGVHAKQYFLHVNLSKIEDLDQYKYRLNKMLPEDIAIHSITEVAEDKHARFDAKKRTYRYFIHQQKEAFHTALSWYFPQLLDFDAMNDAAQELLGKQDFTSLSKLHTDVKTNICTVYDAKWVKINENSAYFEIAADRFLRNMVRATVGTLIEVGIGKITRADFRQILDDKDRGKAAVSVPAHGLFLWEIEY
ncbi:MAG: tRNA pseudouridine(38-40) synthase TruA [Bacteroidota bacterium]